jgi:hypothetical protein
MTCYLAILISNINIYKYIYIYIRLLGALSFQTYGGSPRHLCTIRPDESQPPPPDQTSLAASTPSLHARLLFIFAHAAKLEGMPTNLSVFRTREVRQPTSEFVVACPCPDGLMQDGTQEGNVAYVISYRGARSRCYKRRETAGREQEGAGQCWQRCNVCLRLRVVCCVFHHVP